MNANQQWDITKERRQDYERAAQRHRAAADAHDGPPLRQRIGGWMVKTGTRLLENDLETGVQVTGDHRHAVS
ncbi:MAG: hypothetical protein AAFV33_18670 [Chloroflexota bacterium]